MINKEKMDKAFEDFKLCSPIFIALGDAVRQKLVLDIADAGLTGINVQNLAAKTHLSRPAISHHLKVLKDAQIVNLTKRGTESFYRLCLGERLPIFKKLISQIESILNDMNEYEKSILLNEIV